MAGFKMDDYIDVAERIHSFYERFPEGSLKGEFTEVVQAGGKDFAVYHAQAFRTPDDPCPSDGWAWEPVPGPTSFTKDSELQNAETAAWGRAIVALGFETKKLASRQEVQNRQVSARPKQAVAKPANDPDFGPDAQLLETLAEIDVLADALAVTRSTDKAKVLSALSKELPAWRTDPVDASRAKAKLKMWADKAAVAA